MSTVATDARLVAYGRVLDAREFTSRAGRLVKILSVLVSEHVSVDGDVSLHPLRVYPLPVDVILPDGLSLEDYPIGSEVPVAVAWEPLVVDRYRRGIQPVVRLGASLVGGGR